ncbi:MAG: helix-turn-helix domain-containing protein [Clostridia bacterium]|nr:helix-turn-helix domain-containing protein [Clostridia bacterium]
MQYEAFAALLAEHQTTAHRVAKATGIAPSSLADWKSGRSAPKADKLARIADYFGISLDTMLGRESAPSPVQVPIIGEIRAGQPIITEQTLLGYEKAEISQAEADDYFYLRIRGDSMRNIGMVDGALVLFRKQQYAAEGAIVACLVGGDSATVKRFHREGRVIRLLPENEAYSPIELSTVDFETGEARILGVAKEIKILL